MLYPAVTPIGAVATGDPTEGRTHGELMVARNGCRPRMLLQQVEEQLDGPFGIGAAVHEVADEHDPTLLVIGQLLEFFENHLQLIDLTMHVADDRNWSLNLGLQRG